MEGWGTLEKTRNLDQLFQLLKLSLRETSLKGLGKTIHRAPKCRLWTLRRYPWAGSLVYTAFSGSHQETVCVGETSITFLISSKALEFCLDLLLDPIRSWNASVFGHLHLIDVQEWESVQSSALSTWGCYQEGIGGPGATLQPLAWPWRVCQLWYQFFCLDAAKPYHCLSLLYAPAIYQLCSPIIYHSSQNFHSISGTFGQGVVLCVSKQRPSKLRSSGKCHICPLIHRRWWQLGMALACYSFVRIDIRGYPKWFREPSYAGHWTTLWGDHSCQQPKRQGARC